MKCFPAVFYFNTSHVYINHPLQSLDCTWYHYFNTSHVYINLHMATWGDHQQDFNTSHVYINPLTFITYRQPAIISIHLMFILISYVRRCRRRWESISIHLMFILISFKTSSKGLSIIISIHLMFILICLELTPPAAAFRFQYISCLY